MHNRDLGGRDVADGHGDKTGAYTVPGVIGGLGTGDGRDAVHGGPHDDADAVGRGRHIQPAVHEGLLGCGERVLHEGVHRAREGFGHIVDRVKALEFGRDLNRKAGRVKARDGADAADTCGQRLPVRRDVQADGRQRAHAGDYEFILCQSLVTIFPGNVSFAYHYTKKNGKAKDFGKLQF